MAKKKYLVSAKVVSFCTLEVEAENEEEAYQIAKEADGGDFVTDETSGYFEVEHDTIQEVK